MIEKINADNLHIVKELWDGHKFPIVPKEALPNYGIISFVNDLPVCSCFLFTDSKSICAWLAFVVINKKAKPKERDEGFMAMINEVKKEALNMGIYAIYSPTNNASLMSRLEGCGFVAYDKDVVDLVLINKGGG